MTAGGADESQKSDISDMQMSNPAGKCSPGACWLGTATKKMGSLHIGRFGYDSDMAACLLYLAGPGGVFLNGQIIYLDGGKWFACQPLSLSALHSPLCDSDRM